MNHTEELEEILQNCRKWSKYADDIDDLNGLNKAEMVISGHLQYIGTKEADYHHEFKFLEANLEKQEAEGICKYKDLKYTDQHAKNKSRSELNKIPMLEAQWRYRSLSKIYESLAHKLNSITHKIKINQRKLKQEF